MNDRIAAALLWDAEHQKRRAYTHPLGIYAIEAEGAGQMKLGVTSDPERRVREFQNGNHLRLVLRKFLRVPAPRRVEYAVHGRLWHVHTRGEWFAASERQAHLAIEWAAEKFKDMTDDDFDLTSPAEPWSSQSNMPPALKEET